MAQSKLNLKHAQPRKEKCMDGEHDDEEDAQAETSAARAPLAGVAASRAGKVCRSTGSLALVP